MSAVGAAAVRLVDVDEIVLDESVRVAVTDASAEEVTPPLTAGAAWTEARITWLRDYHRDRRAGLAGPHEESTWAVTTADGVIGSVRLKCTEIPGTLEIGIWLARGARGQGIGTAAVVAAVQRAASLGATAVRADTTATTVGALAVLERLGFSVEPGEGGGASVRGVLQLEG